MSFKLKNLRSKYQSEIVNNVSKTAIINAPQAALFTGASAALVNLIRITWFMVMLDETDEADHKCRLTQSLKLL